jgi:hypothetical protein
VLDLYRTLKTDNIYYIDKKGIQEKSASDTDLPIHSFEEEPSSEMPPKHIEVEGLVNKDLKLTTELKKIDIPVVEATEESLAYYGAELINSKETFACLEDDFPVWNILVGEEYLDNFIMTEEGGGGMSLEFQMDKPHFHMPVSKESHGYYILGKKIDSKKKTSLYRLTAFKIPQGKAVYTYPGVIHCSTALKGNWLIGCTNTKKASSVSLRTDTNKILDIAFVLSSLIQNNIFITIRPK